MIPFLLLLMSLPQVTVQIFGNVINVEPGSLNINLALGQIGTLSCRAVTEFASLIQKGQLIEVYEAKDDQSAAVRIFSGQVSSAKHTHDYAGSLAWMTEVEAQDVNAIPARITTSTFETGEVWPQEDDTPGNLTIDRVVKKVAQHYLQDDAISWEGYVQTAPKIPAYAIDIDLYVNEIFNDLARIASSLGDSPELWVWFIDADRQLHFFPVGYESAPVGIGTDQALSIRVPVGGFGDMSLLSFEENGEQMANQIVFRLGHYVLDAVTEYFTGDGVTKSWNLTKPCNSLPSCKVQPAGADYSEVKTVGVSGTDSPPDGDGRDFYFNAGSPTISADAPLAVGDVLEVTYNGQDNRKILRKDTDAIAERISVGGGSGIYARVIDLNDPATSSDVTQLAESWLDRLKGLSSIVRVRVWDEDLLVQGLRIGQLVFCDPAGFDVLEVTGAVVAGDYLIRSIAMTEEEGIIWRYLELVRGPIVYDSVEYLQDQLKQGPPAARKTAQPIAQKTAQGNFDAPVADAVTNWSLVPLSGTPYSATADIVGAGTGSSYKIDWQYNDLDPDDGDFDTSWASVFPTVETVLECLTITAGSRVATPIEKFAPAVEFTKDVTRVRAKIISGPSDGTFLTTHLRWRT